MNKRGQFYLVTAIIIIVVVISFAAIQNYTKKRATLKIYNIKEELGIESGNVLDFGTFNIESPEERQELITSFSEEYVEYTGEGRNLYLIFGSCNRGVFFMPYEEVVTGTSTVFIGSQRVSLDSIERELGEPIEVGVTSIEQGRCETEVISFGDPPVEYKFELKPGENFYFVISEEVGGEQHVVVS
jgi:hypothetical protein